MVLREKGNQHVWFRTFARKRIEHNQKDPHESLFVFNQNHLNKESGLVLFD